MREREATPGPEAYDIGLGHRLEGHSLEIMQGSLETLQSWASLGVGQADGWPFLCSGERDGAGAAYEFARVDEGSDGRRGGEVSAAGESRDEEKCTGLSRGFRDGRDGEDEEDEGGEEEQDRCDRHHHSTTERLEGVAKRIMFGRSRTPCFAGGSVSSEDLPRPSRSETANSYLHRRAGSRCSRLSPASSAAALRGVPCPECLGVEVATAVNSFVAAAASVSDANLFRRARMTGASVRFGEMPRQRTAPAFSIGRGQRDVTSRLLHTTPGEEIYREARLGRSGKGPASASPRAGDAVTKPRPAAATVVLPDARGGGPRGPSHSGNGYSGTDAAAADGRVFVVDGALGAQVKSCRPTSPSFTLAGPRRAATLFHERLRYDGKVGRSPLCFTLSVLASLLACRPGEERVWSVVSGYRFLVLSLACIRHVQFNSACLVDFCVLLAVLVQSFVCTVQLLCRCDAGTFGGATRPRTIQGVLQCTHSAEPKEGDLMKPRLQ